MTIVLNGTTGITSPAESISGNLTFAGTGNRITGDFSNATAANRVAFQSSTANGNTILQSLPNGTGISSSCYLWNASDLDNSGLFIISNSSSVGVSLNAFKTGTGVYQPISFYTGGSERMRVDTSGNVGIGTSSPTNASGYGALTLNGTTGSFVALRTNGTDTAYVQSNASSFDIKGVNNVPMILYTNNVERARIDSSGNLLVGTTSLTGSGGHVVNFSAGNGAYLQTSHTSGASNGYSYHVFYYNGSPIGNIAQSGTTAVTYNTTSDYRLKENVQPLTGALERVAALKPCTYTWKSAPDEIGEGFIAHELAEVCPQAVTGEKDAVKEDGSPAYQGIDTSFLVATLTAAIQEQQAIIEQLKADVAELKAAK